MDPVSFVLGFLLGFLLCFILFSYSIIILDLRKDYRSLKKSRLQNNDEGKDLL